MRCCTVSKPPETLLHCQHFNKSNYQHEMNLGCRTRASSCAWCVNKVLLLKAPN
jgi:hypothetical protein